MSILLTTTTWVLLASFGLYSSNSCGGNKRVKTYFSAVVDDRIIGGVDKQSDFKRRELAQTTIWIKLAIVQRPFSNIQSAQARPYKLQLCTKKIQISWEVSCITYWLSPPHPPPLTIPTPQLKPNAPLSLSPPLMLANLIDGQEVPDGVDAFSVDHMDQHTKSSISDTRHSSDVGH